MKDDDASPVLENLRRTLEERRLMVSTTAAVLLSMSTILIVTASAGFLFALAMGTVVTLLLVTYINAVVFAPLRVMSEKMGAVSKGNLGADVDDMRFSGEMASVSSSFRRMVSSLKVSMETCEILEGKLEAAGVPQDIVESEIRYRRLFEAAYDGILILDADTGEVVDANPYILDLLGYDRKTVMGKKLWELGPFANVDAARDAYDELQREDYIRYEHLPLETRKGETVDVEFISNIYPEKGDSVIQCNIRKKK